MKKKKNENEKKIKLGFTKELIELLKEKKEEEGAIIITDETKEKIKGIKLNLIDFISNQIENVESIIEFTDINDPKYDTLIDRLNSLSNIIRWW